MVRNPNILFFSDNDPDYMNILAELPVGTDIDESENFSRRFENDINAIIKPYNSIIESKLMNVGQGAVLENDMDFFANRDNKCLMTISFVDYDKRKNVNTSKIKKLLTDSLTNKYAGIQVVFEKNSMGTAAGSNDQAH